MADPAVLGAGRYLLGCAELAALAAFAWLGATRLRSRLLPRLPGPPATLATTVIALAILLWAAELVGTASLFKPAPYLLVVAAVGLALRRLVPRGSSAPPAGGAVGGPIPEEASATAGHGGSPAATGPAGGSAPAPPGPVAGAPSPSPLATALALLIAAIAIVHFAAGVKTRLSTGMTGFDSTWYHGPFAAGFAQGGDTWSLHFIAPQFLAWFYPANAETTAAIGMLAFGRDLLSPLLNLGWFLGCLLACWCIGRPYRVAPWSLALGAVALSVPALADQAGEARNDIVALFFLLAAVAVALNAWAAQREARAVAVGGEGGPSRSDQAAARGRDRGLPVGALVTVGLAAGLAAGTKLNFLLPAAVLVVGLAPLAPRGRHWRSLLAAGLAALAGGGYWYLRNLVQAGNPLPWIHHLGPISLPAPQQALGGREAHSVLSYLTDNSVWSHWFLPGLRDGLWVIWPLLAALSLLGLVLCLWPRRRSLAGISLPAGTGPAGASPPAGGRPGGGVPGVGKPSAAGPAGLGTGKARRAEAVARQPRREWDPILALAGLVGLAAACAWLVAPTSASGPPGMPRGFESGLRYLAPALVLVLSLLPATPRLRSLLAATAGAPTRALSSGTGRAPWRGFALGLAALAVLAALVGYPLQRHYLRDRYADPSFSAPGLDAAFAWARNVSGARIATTTTRQYPLFGDDLSNRVQYVGEETPHGGFEAPSTCRQWRHLLDAGHYDYVVASRDRLEPGKPPYPPQARWTESPNAKAVLRKPPTVVFKLNGPLDPASCGS